jgi:hypothetical protein
MRRQILVLGLLILATLGGGLAATPSATPKMPNAANAPSAPLLTPVSVYGAWHCGNDFCTWASVRNMTDFDTRNRWLINRGDGRPSVNLVSLSFVHPLRLLNKTNDAGTALGIPIGMNQTVVDYFKSRGVRVQLSIGGITYTDAWNQALATNATQLGLNAAEAATRLGVGIEIDYEENSSPNLTGLQAFIDAYRSVHPYDASGTNHAARLTIDLAAGDRWLIALCRKATADWLRTNTPVLDYANAMVTSKQFNNAADAQSNWQEHVDGKAQFNPPILPLAPAKFTGALYIVTGTRAAPECTTFGGSLINTTGNYVQNVLPNGAGTTSGMLGYMFWAAECPSTRRVCTVPPNSCEGGVGVGATTYNVPIPMAPLRQN